MEDIEVPFQWDEDNHNILPVPHFKAPSRCRQSSSFFSCPPLLFFHWIQKDYQEQTLLKNIPVLAENVLTPLRTRRPRAPSLTEDKRRQMKSSIALLLNTGRKKQTKKKTNMQLKRLTQNSPITRRRGWKTQWRPIWRDTQSLFSAAAEPRPMISTALSAKHEHSLQ